MLILTPERVRADSRTRTGDPRITNALLYQLSHIGNISQISLLYQLSHIGNISQISLLFFSKADAKVINFIEN